LHTVKDNLWVGAAYVQVRERRWKERQRRRWCWHERKFRPLSFDGREQWDHRHRRFQSSQ